MTAQETIIETILHDGSTREYIVYVPEIYDDATPTPLLFNFHGFTGQANNHLNSTGMREVADTAGFILVYPQGSLFFGVPHWNVGAWTNGSSADDLGFTEAMIDTLSANYNIDLDRVYSCGYSNGGYFSFELACQLSHRIAAIGSVGGKMSSETFDACAPSHPTPVVSIHGTEDNVVSYYGSQPSGSKTVEEVLTYWVDYNQAETMPIVENITDLDDSDGSIVEYLSYQNGSECTVVDHYKVIGGGHDWPGSWGNQDIDASSIIWNFVSQYDINGLINCGITSNTEVVDDSPAIRIYPNPTSGLITISTDLPKEIDCHIYSLTGISLLSQKIGPGNPTIDVTDLPLGSYFVNIGNQTIQLIKAD